jgi:hypothetical protein
MMVQVVLLTMAVLLPLVILLTFLVARHIYRRQALQEDLSAVTRQHIDLFQGGQLSETAVESAKERIRDLLERGEFAAVENGLRPGTQYVVQVRALAEIGTEDAGRILERQLQRRLTDDVIEQSWYWIDLANGLRSLNRAQSLPHLLRCAEAAGEIPLGHFFAAETVCFLGFGGYLRDTSTPLGRAAVRVLHRAIEGLRHGVPPQVVSEARLGDAIESLWDHRSVGIDPVAVRVFLESLRLLRRAPHAEKIMAEEGIEAEGYSWQVSRLSALESGLEEYVAEAPAALCAALDNAEARAQRDILLALIDLKADAGATLLPLIANGRLAHPELATEALTWAKGPEVGAQLREWITKRIPLERRAQCRRKADAPSRPSVTANFPYAEILRALRGHAGPESESLLLVAAGDWDPTYRAAAVSSFGWWEPYCRDKVLARLQEARRDANRDVAQAARAALARLGERQALQWFRNGLASEDGHRVHESIQLIAAEGLTFLWPDLDRFADSEDPDIAHHAREALERLCEDMDRGMR